MIIAIMNRCSMMIVFSCPPSAAFYDRILKHVPSYFGFRAQRDCIWLLTRCGLTASIGRHLDSGDYG